MIKKNNLPILIFFLVFAFNLNGQQLVKEGNQWNVHFPPVSDPSFQTYKYSIGNDTILDGVSYSKLNYYSGPAGVDLLNTVYLREDSTNKVFIKNIGTPEMVLYDFSLELGDNVTHEFGCTIKVVVIDSVALNNGELRKRIKFEEFDNPEQTTSWIEGIGSIDNFEFPFGTLCIFDSPGELLCFYEDGELLYPEEPRTCYKTNTDELEIELHVEIYPNPFHDKIVVVDKEQSFSKLMIYNAFGQLVASQDLDLYQTEISSEGLLEGIYYLSLVDENGRLFTQRIVHH